MLALSHLQMKSFAENVKHARYQACIWNSVKDPDPPNMDAENFGWKKDSINKCLDAESVPANVPLSPDSVLKLIRAKVKMHHAEHGIVVVKLPIFLVQFSAIVQDVNV